MSTTALPRHTRPVGRNYKWIALSNTTLGVLMAAMNNSILLISLPDIFRGLNVNPLAPSESNYLLWMLLGYMVVTATLLVTFGRLSDIFGRVRMYNAGFVVFTVASLLLFLTPSSGNAGALEIILVRLFQGVGGGLLLANSAAILTDAFPPNERGMALGLNMVATLAGSLFGLLVGGLLAAIWWRAVFLVSVPVGVIGSVWAYLMLREQGQRHGSRHIDLLGNLCFGVGLTIFLIAMTYGITPYGNSNTGWSNPLVIGGLVLGAALLALFIMVEQRVREPLFNLQLFKIRSFAAGCASQLLSSLAYGGLQFVLVVWLQGIWLPLHGYTFESTPFWSAVYLIPLLAGFMIFGAAGGWLSDHVDPRAICTTAMLVLAAGFVALSFFPVDFNYVPFAVVLFIIGAAFGGFSAPNSAAVMNALPRAERGVGSGMRTTFTNAGNPLSLAIFFSIIVIVLSSSLPAAVQSGLTQHGVSAQVAAEVAHVPPTGALFAAFLGYNPMSTLLPPAALQSLAPAARATILGTQFFPGMVGGPLIVALHVIFWFSAALALLAAVFSYLRGERFVYDELEEERVEAQALQPAPMAR